MSINQLVTSMLAMALDDVSVLGEHGYYNDAVEAFDALSDEQRIKARRVYRCRLRRATHYASGAPGEVPNPYLNEWIRISDERDDESPF